MLTPEELRLIDHVKDDTPADRLLDYVLERLRGEPARKPVSGDDGPTDTEMLDWLERNKADLDERDNYWLVVSPDLTGEDCPTPRDAIRAAMRARGDL